MARDVAVTFAGGGNRAFYQVGLMERWRERVEPRLAAVAACSAGSAVALLLLADRCDEARRFFAEQRRGVRRNLQPRQLLSGRRPMPHDRIYRATLRHAFSDGGLERVRAQPFPIRVLCASFPRRVPAALGVALGLSAYQLEKKLRPRMVHPTVGERVGFRARVWDARRCESVDELIELVLASSATPPFTSLGRYGGHRLVDGSMIDNAPAFLADEVPGVRRNLVLLTRPYPMAALGRQGARLYVAPSEPVPVHRWDYTEGARVDDALELGRRDAARLDDALDRFLELDPT